MSYEHIISDVFAQLVTTEKSSHTSIFTTVHFKAPLVTVEGHRGAHMICRFMIEV